MKQIFLRTLAVLVLAAAMAGGVQAQSEDSEWIADKRGCKVANPFPRAGETITWTGECKNGFAQGQGVLQWYLNGKEDDRYEGTLEAGWAEGHGVLSRGDGGKY